MYLFTKENDTFTFGKHKGETIDSIIHRDAQYVQWCIENNIIRLESEKLQKEYKVQCTLRTIIYGSGDNEEDAEMDFCLGLGGGAQGWD